MYDTQIIIFRWGYNPAYNSGPPSYVVVCFTPKKRVMAGDCRGLSLYLNRRVCHGEWPCFRPGHVPWWTLKFQGSCRLKSKNPSPSLREIDKTWISGWNFQCSSAFVVFKSLWNPLFLALGIAFGRNLRLFGPLLLGRRGWTGKWMVTWMVYSCFPYIYIINYIYIYIHVYRNPYMCILYCIIAYNILLYYVFQYYIKYLIFNFQNIKIYIS